MNNFNVKPISKAFFLLIIMLALICCNGDTVTNIETEADNCISRAIFGDPAQSSFVLPYPVGTSYRVLQGYCNRNGSHRNQLAYDFYMPIGTPVSASREGIVRQIVDQYTDTDQQSSHFNYLFIEHNDGTIAFYAHLQLHSFAVSLGEHVMRGQHIANSGSCGTPVPDLHFGVYQGWPVREGYDAAINFRNAQGTLDARNGLQAGIAYLALPY